MPTVHAYLTTRPNAVQDRAADTAPLQPAPLLIPGFSRAELRQIVLDLMG